MEWVLGGRSSHPGSSTPFVPAAARPFCRAPCLSLAAPADTGVRRAQIAAEAANREEAEKALRARAGALPRGQHGGGAVADRQGPADLPLAPRCRAHARRLRRPRRRGRDPAPRGLLGRCHRHGPVRLRLRLCREEAVPVPVPRHPPRQEPLRRRRGRLQAARTGLRRPLLLLRRWPRPLLQQRRHHRGLRARVVPVSPRGPLAALDRLIDRGSKPANSSDLTTTAAAMFGVDEARRHATDQHQSGLRLDLSQLILSDKKDQIGVIGVWGTSGTVGHTSIIFDAYENPNIKVKFPSRAWLRVTRPFHRKQFVRSIVEQFRATTIGVVDFLLEAEGEKTWHELAHEYSEYVSKKWYLIVLAVTIHH
ncbi:uncharacterized protein [Triticum aestivum]|uniref:uncharacterized protein n=1 Tax=Triticum aestivum TaxID=4565 RepID=UPI001D00F04D|nr:uncharacterized protein LOC123139777 [Triticum aestivum]